MPTILHDSNTDQQAAEQTDDLPIEVLFGRRNPRVSEIRPATDCPKSQNRTDDSG
jgi:hypothetical protein